MIYLRTIVLFLFHCNVRSINKNLSSLELYIDQLILKPDVIICSEAWLQVAYGMIKLNGYKHYNNESMMNKADGVIIYVRDNIKHSVNIEIIDKLKVISVVIESNNKTNLKISGIYRCFDYDVIVHYSRGRVRFIVFPRERQTIRGIVDVQSPREYYVLSTDVS